MSIKDLGDGKFLVRVYNPHGGREYRKTVTGRKTANAHEATMKVKFATGGFVDPHAGKASFRDVALQVIGSRDLTPATRLHYLRDCERFLFPIWGDRPIRTLRYSDAVTLTTHVERHASGAGATNALSLARSIMRTAVLDGRLDRNPFTGLKLNTPARSAKTPPSWAQIRASVTPVNPTPYQQVTVDMITVMAGTGMRVGEALGLDAVADVDYLRGLLTVRQQLRWMSDKEASTAGYSHGGYWFAEPKTDAGAERVIPIPSWVVDALARLAGVRPGPVTLPWGDPDAKVTRTVDMLFAPFQPAAFSSRTVNAAKRAGARFSPHDLRRAYATALEQGGVPLRTVQAVLGHEPSGVTMSVYVSVTEESLVAARRVMVAVWEREATPPAETRGNTQAGSLS